MCHCLTLLWFSFVLELQSNSELTLKERNQAVADLEAVREELRDTREEVSLHVLFCFYIQIPYATHNKSVNGKATKSLK